MFVTAFALVYVYNGKHVSLLQFWRKRALGVVLPYVFWSEVYILVNVGFVSPGAFLRTSVFDILTGNASYQLYYILLTMQLYLVFPLFLACIRLFARHPWITLTTSFVLQVLFFYVDFHTIQTNTTPFWLTISGFQDRFFLTYQFYFILGGLTALYFQQVRAFVLRHGRLIASVFIVALAGLWLHFALQVNSYKESVGYATSVLQPVMVFYSLAIIFFALWLACRWVSRSNAGERPRGYRFWHTLSDASFGVYLIHALILTQLLRWLVPALPTSWFEPLRVFLTWFLVAGGSVAISAMLVKIPVLSRLVGRDGTRKEKRSRGAVQSADKLARAVAEEKNRTTLSAPRSRVS
jgi:peptidoglycan/LPS O-acetylase OafA/YrhL